METVYKYPLGMPNDDITIEMHEGAEILYIEVQHGIPCLWARVNTNKPIERKHFRMAGTGHPLNNAGKHIGSFLMEEGKLVFHLFEPF